MLKYRMPGPQRTKGTLRNTRFKARMNKKNKTQKRKQAFYIHELGRKQQEEYVGNLVKFALYISRQLEKEGKVTPVASCDDSFETYYSLDDAEKIIKKLSEKTTSNPNLFQTRAHREFARTKIAKPGMAVSLLMIFLAFMSFGTDAEAKWYEFSSPPGELSAYDTLAAAQIATALLTPVGPAIAGYLALSGLLTRGAGSTQRSYNDYSGKYPLTTTDKYSERVGIILPGTDVLCRGAMYSVDNFYSYMTGNQPQFESERTSATLGVNLSLPISRGIQGGLEKFVKNVSVENVHGYVEPFAINGQWLLEKGINFAPTTLLAIKGKNAFAKTNISKSASSYVNAAKGIVNRNPKATMAALTTTVVGTTLALDETGATGKIADKLKSSAKETIDKYTGTGTKGKQGEKRENGEATG